MDVTPVAAEPKKKTWLIILIVVIALCLICACAAIFGGPVIMTLLGPSVGNVFSDITNSLITP